MKFPPGDVKKTQVNSRPNNRTVAITCCFYNFFKLNVRLLKNYFMQYFDSYHSGFATGWVKQTVSFFSRVFPIDCHVSFSSITSGFTFGFSVKDILPV